MNKLKKIVFAALAVILLNVNTAQATSLEVNEVNNDKVISVNLLTQEEREWSLINNRTIIQNTASYEGDATITPKAIVGDTDSRYQITNTTSFPYSAIVSLDIVYSNGKTGSGTGFMIGENTVATAGHCVYSHDNGGWAKSISVTPGKNGSNKPFGTAYATTLNSVNGWVQNNLIEYDYAVIELNTSIGNNSGWFGLSGNDSSIKDSTVSIVGYAGDKSSYTLWKDIGKISVDKTRMIGYPIDTYKGQSGSPVYWYNSTYGYQAAGIHTRAYTSELNRGVKITSSVFNFLTSF